MLAKTITATVNGLNAECITVEVHTSTSGKSETFMVGLPDNAVKESRSRIYAALNTSSFFLPQPQITTINLAPADVKKEGTGYDLPVAIGLLAAAKIVSLERLSRFMLVGELGLDGSIRSIRGALPIAIRARAEHFEGLIVPEANVREAAVVNNLKVYGASTLVDVVKFLNGMDTLQPCEINTREEFYKAQTETQLDFADVKGQEFVKRAFEIAAAGGHNMILVGAPGCGKSMMAKRLPSILPHLSLAESLETTQIHSIAGKLDASSTLIAKRPFRAPHHTISDTALIGGGTTFQPGEISLAHNGVLFLDELPEYSRNALETLRQPLEDRTITISRTKYRTTLPCSFMLVAAMNPCPCGFYNHPTRHCECSPGQIHRYMNKISGPLLDRIDLQCEIMPLSFEEMQTARAGERSEVIRQRVIQARALQTERFKDEPHIHCNAQMNEKLMARYCALDQESTDLLRTIMERRQLSARAYTRILKVARTIADLDGEPQIKSQHISEAASYRNLDRSDWGE
jgi:magnesium chelatase family protein